MGPGMWVRHRGLCDQVDVPAGRVGACAHLLYGDQGRHGVRDVEADSAQVGV
jgi:hypothetical protein